MNKTFRFSSVSFSPTHLLRTLKHKRCTYLQTLLTTGGILLLLNLLFASAFAQVVDPTICLDPGGLGVVVVNVTNPPGPDGNAPQSFTVLERPLPTLALQLSAVWRRAVVLLRQMAEVLPGMAPLPITQH
jgi:hypothetical protein